MAQAVGLQPMGASCERSELSTIREWRQAVRPADDQEQRSMKRGDTRCDIEAVVSPRQDRDWQPRRAIRDSPGQARERRNERERSYRSRRAELCCGGVAKRLSDYDDAIWADPLSRQPVVRNRCAQIEAQTQWLRRRRLFSGGGQS